MFLFLGILAGSGGHHPFFNEDLPQNSCGIKGGRDKPSQSFRRTA
jgi:hypothetical protein